MFEYYIMRGVMVIHLYIHSYILMAGYVAGFIHRSHAVVLQNRVIVQCRRFRGSQQVLQRNGRQSTLNSKFSHSVAAENET